MGFLLGLLFRLVALGGVLWVAALPLTLFGARITEGLPEETLYQYAALASALLVFPALIFLSWIDTAIGSIVPLIMLTVIMASFEYTDPQYSSLPVRGALAGKTALVVGGNRGIGLETVKEYIRQGANVMLSYRSKDVDEGELKSLEGGKYLGSIRLDLEDRESLNSFVERVKSTFQVEALDVLVINSGIACSGVTHGLEGFERTVAVNFLATGRLMESSVALLEQGREPVVVFSSSGASRKWFGTVDELLDLKSTLGDVNNAVTCGRLYARSKVLMGSLVLQYAKDYPKIRFFAPWPLPTHTEMLAGGMEKMNEFLRYPAFFQPGSPLFDAFIKFWMQALSRTPEAVAKQYAYAAWNGNSLTSGCSFIKESCLKPTDLEIQVQSKVRNLL